MTTTDLLTTVRAATEDLRRIHAEIGDVTSASVSDADSERVRVALKACVDAKRAAMRGGCTMRDFLRIGA